MSDKKIAELYGVTINTIAGHRRMLGLAPIDRATHKVSKYMPHKSFDVPFEALSPRAQKLVVDAEARL